VGAVAGLITTPPPPAYHGYYNHRRYASYNRRRQIYALLLAWNDYLYAAVLLAVRNMTVAVTQGQLFSDTDAPWNAMMAAAIIYVLPPIALLFALRRYVVAGLTMAHVTE
jgi:ABC-type glycerol-3-phosphate transport system permease component